MGLPPFPASYRKVAILPLIHMLRTTTLEVRGVGWSRHFFALVKWYFWRCVGLGECLVQRFSLVMGVGVLHEWDPRRPCDLAMLHASIFNAAGLEPCFSCR
jgi:hypothetical protein